MPLKLILALVALAALLAGCGGDDGGSDAEGVPPEDWAASVCGALAGWQSSLQEQSQGPSSAVLEADSPESARDQIGEFLTQVISETETMIGEVRAAGQPAVDQGDQIAEDFNNGLQQMRTAFEAARQQVEEVPTDNPQAFQQELTGIGQELQTQGEAIGNQLDEIDERYDADELSQAFDDTPACSDFVNTPSG